MPNNTKGGRRYAINPNDVLKIIEEADAPFLSTGEVAERVDASRPTVRKRLAQLEEDGTIRKRTVGGNTPIWYLPNLENRRLNEYLDDGSGTDAREVLKLVERYGPDTLERAANLVEKVDDDGLEVLEVAASALEEGGDEQDIIKTIEGINTPEPDPGQLQTIAQAGFVAVLLGAMGTTYGFLSILFGLGFPAEEVVAGVGMLGVVCGFIVLMLAVIAWNLRRLGERFDISGIVKGPDTPSASPTKEKPG